MMLVKLLQKSDHKKFQHEVVSLLDLGPLAGRIRDIGVSVSALGMARGVPNPLAVARLAIKLRRDKHDAIQTWMYHSNLVGGLAARLAGRRNIIWGIHSSGLDPKTTKRLSRMTARAGALLSAALPSRIVCCSKVAAQEHYVRGFKKEKFVIIPNGFDISEFAPNPQVRAEVRKSLGITESSTLIGMFARFHPQKDHSNFLEAARLLYSRRPDAHFILCGAEITAQNDFFAQRLKMLPFSNSIHLLGIRSDISTLIQSLDVATLSSSHGEAFPLFLGEAMASCIPCVGTNVGDTEWLLGDAGALVSPRNPEALSRAWEQLMILGPEGRRTLGKAARERIINHFELRSVVAKYEKVYLDFAR